jgi:hypothetical protein
MKVATGQRRRCSDCWRVARRAVIHLTEMRTSGENQHGAYFPVAVQSAVDRVEAQIRSGAITDAERSLAVLEEKVCRTGLRWASAGAARCRWHAQSTYMLIAGAGHEGPEFVASAITVTVVGFLAEKLGS